MKLHHLLYVLPVLWTTPALADQGNWQNQAEKSELTGITSVYWHLEAENKLPDSIGIRRAPVLSVMCLENETRVIFSVNDYMGMDAITMAYRIDNGPIKRIGVSVSTDGRVFGFWNGTGVSLLRNLKGKSKLVVAASPWGQGPSEAVFNIAGVNAMLENVGKTCGW
jgi:hypothetical protein